jgi:hypothetical protein
VPNRRKIERRASWWFWAGVALFVSTLGTVGLYLGLSSDAQMQRSGAYVNVLSLYAAFAQLLMSAAAIGYDHLKTRREARPAPLDPAARALARVVGEVSAAEVRRRGLRFPLPLALRWRQLRVPLGDGGTPSPAGEDERPDRRLLTAFRALPHQRLLILGEPGSGKSALALLFTLAALEPPALAVRRSAASVTIPVLTPLASWRPQDETLRAFILRRLPIDYPKLLHDGAYGPDAVARLIDEGRILPVLDGLDEMPASLIRQAIGELNDYSAVPGRAVVVTCRRAVYNEVVAGSEPLSVDEIIVLESIRADDTIEYLAGNDSPESSRWAGVIGTITEEPAGPLATALSTPLMTSLARTVYRSKGNPDELTNLSTVDSIQEHLLGRLLSAVYPGDRDGRRHERPLSILAYYLEPDLAWWELALAVPSIVVAGVITIGSAALGAILGALVHPFADDRLHNTWYGLVVGLAGGLITGLSAVRSVVRRHSPQSRHAVAVLAAAARDSLTAMLVIGVGLLLVHGNSLTSADVPGLVQATTFAGLAGLAISLIGNGLSAGRGLVPSRTRINPAGLAGSLGGGLLTALLLGAPISLLVGIVANIEYGLGNGISTASTVFGTVLLGVGIPIGIGRWLGMPVTDQDAPTPKAMLRADRAALVIGSLVGGSAVGVGAGLLVNALDALRLDVIGSPAPVWSGGGAGLVAFAVVLCGSGSPWFAYVVARAWFTVARRSLPWNLIGFLDGAAEDDVMRCTGSVYQFRHDRLRAFLSNRYVIDLRPARWLVDWTGALEAAPVVTTRRQRRVVRLVAAGLAPLVLATGLAFVTVPQLRGFIDRRDARIENEQARNLIRVADQLQARDADRALRLRIAAAVVDSDRGATDDLAAFLRMRLAPGPYGWERTNRLLAVGDWAVGLDPQGVVTGWNLDQDQPSPVELGAQIQDIVPVGGTDWLELVGLDSQARLQRLTPAGPVQSIMIGGDPDRVEPLGDTGWVAISRGGELEAVDLTAARSAPVVLAQRSTEHVVIADSAWVVSVQDGTATAWHADPNGLSAVSLGSHVNAVRRLEHDLVELSAADGSLLSQWDLTSKPSMAVDLGPLLSGLPDSLVSTSDGHWVVVNGPTGATAWDITAKQPHGVSLSVGTAVAPGPGDWVVISTVDTGSAAWNLADRNPEPVPLDQTVSQVSEGPGPWLVLTDIHGRVSGWNLTVTPPRKLALAPKAATTEVAAAGWLQVREPGEPTVAWPTRPVQPAPVRLGAAVHGQVSANGRWAVLTFTDEAVENLTAVWDLQKLSAPMPAGALDDPVRYACSLVGRGLLRLEWAQLAPGVPYRSTC